MTSALDLAKANLSLAKVKLRSSGHSQIGAGTSEIRRWLIGREVFEESA